MQKIEYAYKDTQKDLTSEILDQFLEIFSNGRDVSLANIMINFEKAILMRALSQFHGNLKKTSIFLGIKYTTLHQKMKKHNIYIRKSPFLN